MILSLALVGCAGGDDQTPAGATPIPTVNPATTGPSSGIDPENEARNLDRLPREEP
jgi:hypothetical protein